MVKNDCTDHKKMSKCEGISKTTRNSVDLISPLYYNIKVHGFHVLDDVSVLCSEGGKENV
jgi:hypothetical protein